jgi:hypothetical protein
MMFDDDQVHDDFDQQPEQPSDDELSKNIVLPSKIVDIFVIPTQGTFKLSIMCIPENAKLENVGKTEPAAHVVLSLQEAEALLQMLKDRLEKVKLVQKARSAENYGRELFGMN